MLHVALTITCFFYCNHPAAQRRKLPKTNMRDIFSLLLLLERSHRNQAWLPASMDGQVGRGQSVNLVTYDIRFFQCANILKHPRGQCCLIWLQGGSILLCFNVPAWKNSKKNYHPSCFVTVACSLFDMKERFLMKKKEANLQQF